MSRFFDDLPPIATDQELLEWANSLVYETRDELEPSPAPAPVARADRPVVPERDRSRLTLEELLLDIEVRATEVYERSRALVIVRP